MIAAAEQTEQPRRAPLLSVDDLAALPEPTWLLDGMLPAGLNVLYGPSGVGKSFLALDWALCTAAGERWYGRQAEPGWVIYIAAEGVAGLYRRIQAWTHSRSQPPPARIRFMPTAPNLLDRGEVLQTAAAIASLPHPPALIVVDTMARCMIGGDENSAKDVGRFIAAVDELRAPYQAAALVIHHTGKDGEAERGSSALRGASDAMLALKPDGAGIRLECVKQKDAAEFDPWNLHLEPALESCILRTGTNSAALAPTERQILEEVSAAFGTAWASSSAIRDASTVAKSSFYRSLKSLTDRGFIEAETTGRSARYRLTDDGQRQVVPAGPSESHETGPVSPTSQSFKGLVGLDAQNGTNDHGDSHDADAELQRIRAKFGKTQ